MSACNSAERHHAVAMPAFVIENMWLVGNKCTNMKTIIGQDVWTTNCANRDLARKAGGCVGMVSFAESFCNNRSVLSTAERKWWSAAQCAVIVASRAAVTFLWLCPAEFFNDLISLAF